MSLASKTDAGRDARGAMPASEDTDRGTGVERSFPRAPWQALADFNPLMARAMRAQQLAEGRLYRITSQE